MSWSGGSLLYGTLAGKESRQIQIYGSGQENGKDKPVPRRILSIVFEERWKRSMMYFRAECDLKAANIFVFRIHKEQNVVED